MLISTLAGLGSLASTIGGAISSARNNKKARELISQQRDENRKWYQARMAEDYTSRTDAQNILTKQRELLAEQYGNARAAQAVAGTSDESVALQKKAATEAMADTMSNIASQASSYKEGVDNQYRQTDAQLNQQQAQEYLAQGNAVAAAGGQAASAGVNLAGGIIGTDKDKDIFKKQA